MMKALTDFLASALPTERIKPMSTDGEGSTDSFADTLDELLASTQGCVIPASSDAIKSALEQNGGSIGSEAGASRENAPRTVDHTLFNQISELPEASPQVTGTSQPQLMDELTMDITKPGHDLIKSAPELASTSSDVTLTDVTVQEVGLEGGAKDVFHTTMTHLAESTADTQSVASNPRDGASRLLQSATVIAGAPESANVEQPLTPAQVRGPIDTSQQMAVDVPLGRAQAETTQQTVGLPLMGTPLMDEARSADFTMTMVETGRKLAAHSTAIPIKAMPVTGTTNPAGVALEGMPEASPTRTAPAGSDWLGLTDRLQFADVTDRPSTKEAKLEALTDRAAVMPATSTALKTDLISGSQRVMDAGTRVSTVEPQQFGNEMATHVRVLKSRSGGEVKLNLHPAELGRMSISVSTDGNDTRVAFVVETPQARQAVEAAMPRLREMLDSAGLSLSDSDVSEQRNRQSEGSDGGSRQQNGGTSSSDGDDAPGHTAISLTLDPDRLVDTYI
jgi:hypothetical protein